MRELPIAAQVEMKPCKPLFGFNITDIEKKPFYITLCPTHCKPHD